MKRTIMLRNASLAALAAIATLLLAGIAASAPPARPMHLYGEVLGAPQGTEKLALKIGASSSELAISNSLEGLRYYSHTVYNAQVSGGMTPTASAGDKISVLRPGGGNPLLETVWTPETIRKDIVFGDIPAGAPAILNASAVLNDGKWSLSCGFELPVRPASDYRVRWFARTIVMGDDGPEERSTLVASDAAFGSGIINSSLAAADAPEAVRYFRVLVTTIKDGKTGLTAVKDIPVHEQSGSI